MAPAPARTESGSVGDRDRDDDADLQKKAKSRRPASMYDSVYISSGEFSCLASLLRPRGRLREVHEHHTDINTTDTAFRQQRLKAWQPILTPKTVLPLFFTIGIIFAPIGALLLYASAQVQEIVLDYSDCLSKAPNGTDFMNMPSSSVKSSFRAGSSNCTKSTTPPRWKQTTIQKQYGPDTDPVDTQLCSLQFNIPTNLDPPVLFYYRLTNFYQNHRRYVKSLDTDQLSGEAVPAGKIASGSCDPLRLASDGKPYYPCGLIANSQFNDTFRNPVQLNTHFSSLPNITYNMTDRGIAWASDAALYGQTKYQLADISPPPNWYLRYQKGYTESNPPPDLHTDEAFQVWMRTAGLPAFSKLAKRNDNETMQCSTYQVDVENNFPVTIYGGSKAIVISTRTVMGGKNPFLGIAYVAVGGICIVLGTLFTVTHLVKPRKLGDHTHLTWNNDRPSTATASGVQRHGTDTA